MNKISVRVPATTANLGAGFDVFGMALTLYNDISFTKTEASSEIVCRITGEGADELAAAGTDNLVVHSMQRLASRYRRSLPGGVLTMDNRIPLARGLGSSSAAIVGGLTIAGKLLDVSLAKTDLLELAVAIEGHPDNVAPALFGNCVLSARGEHGWETVEYTVPTSWKWVACVPSAPLSTQQARQALPTMIPHADAVKNVAAAAFFLAALTKEEPHYLRTAFHDRLHVPYRLPLIENGSRVLEAALQAGAYGATISGSGSTLLAVCDETTAPTVAQAMARAFGASQQAQSFILDVCSTGVQEI